MRLRIERIEAMASERPEGYVAAVISRGVIDGEWLEIPTEALAELRAIYRPARQPEPALPSAGAMAWTAAKAAASEAAARFRGEPALNEKEISRRFVICTGCENFRASDNRCSLCGCFAAYKTRLRSQNCPAGKW